jgi:hypothetical protein
MNMALLDPFAAFSAMARALSNACRTDAWRDITVRFRDSGSWDGDYGNRDKKGQPLQFQCLLLK